MLHIKSVKVNEITVKSTQRGDDVDSSLFGEIVAAMEETSATDETPVTVRGNTLSVGSKIENILYKMDDNTYTPMSWVVLGYNRSIPEYVKYRRPVDGGYHHIWVKSTKNGLLAPIAVGDAVYTREYNATTHENDYSEVGDETITSISPRMTAYGNLCTYSVSRNIMTSQGEYAFCGYNLTIQSEMCLGFRDNDVVYYHPQFNPNMNNDWSQSSLRSWMNGKGPGYSYLSAAKIRDVSNRNETTLASIACLNTRFDDYEGIDRNIMPAVNRTWVHQNLRAGKVLDLHSCEHVTDRWWILGVGHVNCFGPETEYYFPGSEYDTSKFSGVFNVSDCTYYNEPSRIKHIINPDGSEGSVDPWWLRSPCGDTYNWEGGVNKLGAVVWNNGNNVRIAVSPVCLIG